MLSEEKNLNQYIDDAMRRLDACFSKDEMRSALEVLVTNILKSKQVEAAVQQPVADLMCQWKGGKISGDELAEKLFSLFASTPSSAVLEAQEKQEPEAWLARGIHGGKVIAAKLHDYKQDADNTASMFIEHYGAAETVPLYAAPVVPPFEDFFPDACRLALELECLLLSCKDNAAVSKWWDSAHEALEQHRELIAAPVVPPDRVMVPREPTEAMLDAAMNRYKHVSPEARLRFFQMHRENFRCDYKAMLAAAEGKSNAE